MEPMGHGDQEEAQLLPKKVEALAGQRVVAVSAGGHHSLALTADGGVWSWGSGVQGKLGHGDMQGQLLPKKIEALTGQRVVALSAGWQHSLALTADSAFFTWGQGETGCLGHGEDLSNQLLPKKVEAWAPGQEKREKRESARAYSPPANVSESGERRIRDGRGSVSRTGVDGSE